MDWSGTDGCGGLQLADRALQGVSPQALRPWSPRINILNSQLLARKLIPSVGRDIVTPRENLRRHNDKNGAHSRPVRDPTAVYPGARPPGRGAGSHRHRAALDPQLVVELPVRERAAATGGGVRRCPGDRRTLPALPRSLLQHAAGGAGGDSAPGWNVFRARGVELRFSR